ncbi:MAG: fasciclin domain-containing protein [Anaerolineales bacterium]|nr:fasciclin domain-containing protein [Anaerolineales bacterium]
MKQRVRTILPLAVVLALMLSLLPVQTFAQEGLSAKADLVETAIAAGDFDTLVELVQTAGLAETLQGEGPFTVFAPTDEAFAALPADVLDALAADPEMLQSVLLYHVIPGRLIAALISDGKEVATAEGSNVLFSFADGVKQVNGATIVAKDIQASNGVIHVIDSVMLPPAIAATLGVAEADSEEAAMAETEVMTDTAETETAMAETEVMTDTAETDMAMADMAMTDIVDTAVAAGSFNTLAAAVQAAGLVDALKGDGPFTVFAPTDDAFAKLPQETIDALLADPTGDLSQILLYHVVPGKVMAADLSDGLEVDTLQGSPVVVTLSDAGAMINDANIIATDIEASNGVIHVIDSVLMPPLEADAMAADAAAEATPEAAASEAASMENATEAPMTEAAPAPENLPVTGGERNDFGALVAALVLVIVAGFAVATRRRLA